MITISLLPERYSVCRLAPDARIPAWVEDGLFLSITRTIDELSVVCCEACVPPDVRSEPGWRVLRLEGPFDFDQIGVLAGVLVPLARAGVSVFTLSTFDTDYVLVKEESMALVQSALGKSSYKLIS